MPVKDYNTDPDLNTTISGINIAEGCAPSGINNAIRQLMADVKEEFEGEDGAVSALNTALRALIAEEVARAMAAASAAQSSANAAQSTANAAQSTANAAYPKSGGALGGPIIRNGYLAQNSVDDNLLIIRGGTDGTSAFLGLCGKNHENNGAAYLVAANGTESCYLFVSPNGSLACKGKNVWDSFAPSSEKQALTVPASGGIVTAPASGFVSIVGVSTDDHAAFVGLYNSTAGIGANTFIDSTDATVRSFVPVREGDSVVVTYARVTVRSLTFTKSIGGTI